MIEGLVDDYTLWSYAVRLFAQDALGAQPHGTKTSPLGK